METQIQVWQGDYGYSLLFTLLDAQGNPFDLTDNTGLTFVGQLAQFTQTSFSGAMVVADPTAGTCAYVVGAGNFSMAGQYNAQIRIAFVSEVVTFGNIQVNVNPKIPY